MWIICFPQATNHEYLSWKQKLQIIVKKTTAKRHEIPRENTEHIFFCLQWAYCSIVDSILLEKSCTEKRFFQWLDLDNFSIVMQWLPSFILQVPKMWNKKIEKKCLINAWHFLFSNFLIEYATRQKFILKGFDGDFSFHCWSLNEGTFERPQTTINSSDFICKHSNSSKFSN